MYGYATCVKNNVVWYAYSKADVLGASPLSEGKSDNV